MRLRVLYYNFLFGKIFDRFSIKKKKKILSLKVFKFMSWVPINAAERTVLNFLSKIDEDHKLIVLSFKKDRKVTFTKHGNEIIITEDGFKKESFQVNAEELKKNVKEIISKEFPRSHKVQISMKKTSDD